jgi:hypothetical protein
MQSCVAATVQAHADDPHTGGTGTIPGPVGGGVFAGICRERERGRRSTAARCAEGRPVAADPVARGRPGPTNNASGGEKVLLCQRPGRRQRWCQGGSGGRGIGRRRAPAPSPARAGTIAGTAVPPRSRSWSVMVAWAGGGGVFAGICGEREDVGGLRPFGRWPGGWGATR